MPHKSPVAGAGFWQNAGTEPKRKYRWILFIDGIPYWTIKKVDKPSYTITTAEHQFINHKFYFPGRVEYNEIGFTIVDSTVPDAAETLRQIIFAGGYRLPTTQEIATQSITKLGATNALGTIEIRQISGGGIVGSGAGNGTDPDHNNEGDILESWTLKNAFITSVELGDLDYSSDDLNEITVKVRYDYAILNDITTATGETEAITKPSLGYAVAVGDDPVRQD
tara:strand:- start:5900 stop:6568 length:669 start_codon:yes stop_codon:yes gene_type:complete